MSERRYKLQINTTEAEIELVGVLADNLRQAVCRIVGVPEQFTVPKHWLKEIPPPIPAEPEPGAYLIGGRLAVRFRVPDGWTSWHWQDRGHDQASESDSWHDVWNALGGPDVDIVPLVAANPLVDAVVTAAKAWREALVLTGIAGLTPKASALADAVFALSAADRAEAGE